MNKIITRTAAALCAAATLSAGSVFADFTDMPNDSSRQALENAVKNGLLTGYDTGEIKPYDNITRAQMAAIITRAFGAESTADLSSYKDMKEGQWYYDAMSKAVAMNAFQGDGENLNPESNITFQEAFAVLARVFDLQSSYDIEKIVAEIKKEAAPSQMNTEALDKFSDKAEIADWAVPTTLAIVEGGYWSGKDGALTPTAYINRSEFATVMDNLVQVYIDAPGEYTNEETDKNVLVRSKDVTLDNVKGEKSAVFVGDSADNVTLGSGVDIDKLVVRGGNVMAKGTYNQIRMIGHNIVTDISEVTKVKVQVYGRYPDSKVYLGVKDVG